MSPDQKTTGNVLAGLAIVLAAAALIVSIVAINRSGREGENVAVEETQDAGQAVEIAAARTAARARLAALETRIAAQEGYAEAAEEAQAVRLQLREAYATASAEVRQEWQELDANLNILEQQLREESADAVGTLERLLAALRQDLRTDEE